MEKGTPEDSSRSEAERITREAVDWFVKLEGAGPLKRAAFVRWLQVSKQHIDEYLAVTEVWRECGEVIGPGYSRENLIQEALGGRTTH